MQLSAIGFEIATINRNLFRENNIVSIRYRRWDNNDACGCNVSHPCR